MSHNVRYDWIWRLWRLLAWVLIIDMTISIINTCANSTKSVISSIMAHFNHSFLSNTLYLSITTQFISPKLDILIIDFCFHFQIRSNISFFVLKEWLMQAVIYWGLDRKRLIYIVTTEGSQITPATFCRWGRVNF